MPGRGVRPTTDRVREAWMSILGDRLRGATAADLFAGSGALGLEALSRGAAHVTFVERHRRAVRVLKRNVRTLDARAAAAVIRTDVLSHIRVLEAGHYDLALADPPYDHGYAFRLLAAYRRTPFSRELWIEHDVREVLPPEAVAEHRRYGDTVLTRVKRAGDGSDAHSAGAPRPRLPDRVKRTGDGS